MQKKFFDFGQYWGRYDFSAAVHAAAPAAAREGGNPATKATGTAFPTILAPQAATATTSMATTPLAAPPAAAPAAAAATTAATSGPASIFSKLFSRLYSVHLSLFLTKIIKMFFSPCLAACGLIKEEEDFSVYS